MKKLQALSIIILFLLTGCVTINLPPASPTLTSVVDTPAIGLPEPTVMPTSVPGLTLEVLSNSEYLSPTLSAPIKLENGKFSGMVNGTELTATIMPMIQWSDLNADGVDDVALFMSENTGGSGNFVSLIVIFSQNGKYIQSPGVFIDDRPLINQIAAADGKIIVDLLVHGPNDPMVSPTQAEIQEYSLIGNNLFLTRLISTTSGNTQRSITIDTPAKGDVVSTSLRISGSMPIAPFENTLLLKILDANKNEVFTSGFMVQAADVGAPATFDNVVEIPQLPSGSVIVLYLEELSMADGAPLNVASVVLRVQ